MEHGGVPVMREAMDPIAFFVIAIIVFNIVSSIVKGLRTAAARAAKSTDAGASQRLTQSLQQRQPAAAQAAAAARAAELARLRKALLASAGVPDADVSASQPSTPVASVRPALVVARAARVQTSAPAMSQASPVAAAAVVSDNWSLQSPGSLMSLESASTAFERLATPGSAAAAAQSAAAQASPAAAQLAVLQGPDSGMNMFIAAAIVGPCAALRPLGHTPGGW
jgi:plasmid stability protein